MATNPWTDALDRKTVELISVAINAACTNLNSDGTRRHIRQALDAGATRDELLMVLKMASLLSIHTCSLGAPILLEEASNADVTAKEKRVETPVCDRMRAAGQWNVAWDGFYKIDPGWTEAFIACGAPVYSGGARSETAELLSIAFDVSFTHMYAPGVRRHVKAALKLGATIEEIGCLQTLRRTRRPGVQHEHSYLVNELARTVRGRVRGTRRTPPQVDCFTKHGRRAPTAWSTICQ